MLALNALAPNVVALTASPAPPAARPEVEATQIIQDAVVRIEELPDYQLRQQEALRTFMEARAHATSQGARDLLRMAAASVNYKQTLYGALEVARIAENALVGGQFGTAPQLATATARMIDTLRYNEKDDAAWRVLKEMKRVVDEPGPRVALDMAQRVHKSLFIGDAGHGPFDATRHAVQAIAAGFEGTPTETLALGLTMCHDVHGSRLHGVNFAPVIETLAATAPSAATRSHCEFLGKMAGLMGGEAAEQYLKTFLPREGTLPRGDAGRLRMATEALRVIDDGTHLGACASPFLATMAESLRGSEGKGVAQMALALDRSLHSRDVDRKGRQQSLADTSGLVRNAMQRFSSGRGLCSDADTLAFAREAMTSILNPGAACYGDLFTLLADSVQSAPARQALTFASELASPAYPGGRATRETVVRAIDQALGAVAGHPLDPIAAGRALISTLEPSDIPYGYRALFTHLRKDPARAGQAGMLDLGCSACGFGTRAEEARTLAEIILTRVTAGRTDTEERPLALLRDLMACLPSADRRLQLVSATGKELVRQTAQADAARFLDLALDLVRSGADEAGSVAVFERILAKVEEIADGKPLVLVDDSLDVINAVPDRLLQANMLRSVMRKHAEELVRAGTLSEVVEGPLEELSAVAETSTKRLQMQVDLLNVLSAASRSQKGTWHVCRQLLGQFPESQRDIVAYSLFDFIRTDPGSLNLDRIRDSYLPAADWKTLQDAVAGARSEPNTFALLKAGIEAIDTHDRSNHRGHADFAGALSLLLLQEVATRMAGNAPVDAIVQSYAEAIGRGRGRLDSVATQDAVLDVMRAMLHDSVQGKPMAEMAVLDLDRCWKPGDAESNRRSVLFTLETLSRDSAGTSDSVEHWVMENGGSGSPPAAPARVQDEGDYVIVGGVVIPKRRDTQF